MTQKETLFENEPIMNTETNKNGEAQADNAQTQSSKKNRRQKKKNKNKANAETTEPQNVALETEKKDSTTNPETSKPTTSSQPKPEVKKPEVKKPAPKKTDNKAKGSKKGQNVGAFVKRLANAKQLADQYKKEQEERERELERKRQEELEREAQLEKKRLEKKQKEKEKRKRLKEEGKLLSKTKKGRKARDQKGLQRLLDGGAICVALNKNTGNVLPPKPIVPSLASELKPVEVKTAISSSATSSLSTSPNVEESSDSEEVEAEIKRPYISDPVLRIKTRMEENKNNIRLNKLRSPIICVMGHVDTGKTKILDKLRNTHVQDGEAGGITQQIGVTNVPLDAIQKSVRMCPKMADFKYLIKGLGIIDTPGHYSFRNLRSLGSSLCDFAILIVDIMHGIEAQTKESIKLLLSKKVPFVIALNKVDLITGWKSNPEKSIFETLEDQSVPTQQHFEEMFKNAFLKFSEIGLNIALYNKNTNPSMFISAIPTSARTGDGIGDIIAYICEYSQNNLAQRLAISKELDATVMEVRFCHGLGTTIDVILVNGTLKTGDRIIVPGIFGPIVTQIRGLHTPPPLKEMRVKANYINHTVLSKTQGVKISASNMENAMAGLPLYVAQEEDEVDYYKNELQSLIDKTFASFKKKDKGVYVVASTLGSLEALLSFLTDSKIPYFGFNIGPVHKKDVTTAAIMNEHEPMYSVILAFDVKVDTDARELADQLKVKIFTADIIYHLYENYLAYEKSYRQAKAKEFRHLAIFPCVLRILPQNIFKTRDPIIVGVSVEKGTARVGTPLCVPTRENMVIGVIASIEINHKNIDTAKTGQEITRESIDIMKEYFREELTRQDWVLIKDLKNTFDII